MHFAVAVALLLMTNPVLAFKPEGHAELEALAYGQLAETAEGRKILRELVIAHVLLLAPDSTALLTGSGGPDASFERQFDTRNQAFHFMAENGDVIAATKSSNPKRTLLERALPKNLQLMRLLFNETVENPVGAHQAGRGFYVLLHMVGDSFSREHVERTDNKLVTIKGWELLGLMWPNVAKESVPSPTKPGAPTLSLLHRSFRSGADLDWRDIAHGQLMPEGRAAVDAMKDLVETIYYAREAVRRAGGAVERDRRWADFIGRHFQPALCSPEEGKDSQDCRTDSPLSNLDLTQVMPLSKVDSFPSMQWSLGFGHRFTGGPDSQFVQLMFERHRVPGAATSFASRLRWAPGFTLRKQLSGLPGDGNTLWWQGTEVLAHTGASFVVPYAQWLGVAAGGGMRVGPGGGELGGAAMLSVDLYARSTFGLKLKYEHNWWYKSGHANLLGLSISLFTPYARKITPVKQDSE